MFVEDACATPTAELGPTAAAAGWPKVLSGDRDGACAHYKHAVSMISCLHKSLPIGDIGGLGKMEGQP